MTREASRRSRFGYISKDYEKELIKSKVVLITPKRKNMYIKTSSFAKKKITQTIYCRTLY